MNLAIVMALSLCGQTVDVYTSDDTLDQWEHGLLESKWTLTDKKTGFPRMLLVLKCWPVDHRVFEFTMRNPWDEAALARIDGSPLPRIEVWTGTYKMISRKYASDQLSVQDLMQMIRLSVEQHWVPASPDHYWPLVAESRDRLPQHGLSPHTLAGALESRDLIHWTDEISYIHWTEHKEFKEFFAELIFDAPFMRKSPPSTSERMKFFLRSDAVKKIGWWKIGTQYEFSAVNKHYDAPPYGH